MIRKFCIVLSVFLFIAVAPMQSYCNVSSSDVISYCSHTINVSSEVLKTFFKSDYKIFGKFSDSLGALDVIDKLRKSDNKGAVLSAANFACLKFISKVSSKGAGILTVYHAYCAALVIAHDRWIPSLEEKIYQRYKNYRNQHEDPDMAYTQILTDIHPVLADVKKKYIYPKYKDKPIPDEKTRKKIGDQINKDTDDYMIAMFEGRYNKEKAVEIALAAEKDIEKSREKFIKELKAKLTMKIEGKVFDRDTKKPVANAKVKIKNYNLSVATYGGGTFTLTIPYKTVKDAGFKISITKKGYKPALSNKIYSFEKGIPKPLTCYLTPLKEEEDLTEEELKEQLNKCGEDYWDAHNKICQRKGEKAKELEDEYTAANKNCHGEERGKCISINDRKYRKALHEDLHDETQAMCKKNEKTAEKCRLTIRRKLTILELKEYEEDMLERVKAWVEWRKTSGEEEMERRKEVGGYIEERRQQGCKGCPRDLKAQFEEYTEELEEDERKNREIFKQRQKESEEYRESHLKNAENVYKHILEEWNQGDPEYKIESKDMQYLHNMLEEKGGSPR